MKALDINPYITNQYAYKEKHNTSTMALIKCYHSWVKWLDEEVVSKAFDSVPHDVVSNKLKPLDINPYITNFLDSRKQRVVVDGVTTEFLSINRGVPQGSVFGSVLFALMVNDVRQVHPGRNLLIKFADDTNLGVLVKANCDTCHIEVNNIERWALNNCMTLNLTKTKEMVVRGRTSKPIPSQIPSIVRVPQLNLLGLTFQEDPCNCMGSSN